MALLENLIVEPSLFQYDTGPEAQVGDQVKLFLDQDANPGYPEFIFGVIQHPITKVNCDTATSYDIEYDEADLVVPDSLLVIGDVLTGTAVVSQIQVVANELDAEIAARIAGDLDAYDNFVAFTEAQALTPEQKDQALENAGILPLQIESYPNESSGEITGVLVPDATGNFYPIADIGGFPAFASSDYPSTYPHQLFTYTGAGWLLRHYIAPGVYSTWLSANITIVNAPDPGEATGWTPSFAVGTSVATGTPTVTYTYGTEAYLAVYGDRYFLNTGSLIAPIWIEVIPVVDGSATNLDIDGGNIQNVVITEGVVAIGNSGTSKTISLTNGTFQTVTLTGNCTFTMPTPIAGASFTLKVLSGAGGFTGAFTGVKWPASVAPTITATAGRYDILEFKADGTAWSGRFDQNYTP